MSKPLGRLLVHVVEAKNLPAMDWNGSSDPFCLITLGKLQYKTDVQMKTLQPVWNSRHELEIYSMNDNVEFTIFDWDRFKKNDKIGSVSYPLSKLTNGKNELWLDLPQVNGKSPVLHVLLQIQP